MRRRLVPVVGLAILALTVPVVGAAAPPPATPQKAPVLETGIALSPESLFPGSLVQGADGNMWALVRKGQPGEASNMQKSTFAVDRIAPTGQVAEFALPPRPPLTEGPTSIAAGPESAIWYLAGGRLGKVTTDGQVTEVPVDPSYGSPQLAGGGDGNLWFADYERNSIVRLTPAGQATAFPLPRAGSGPGGAAAGPDGAIWFLQSRGGIGRIQVNGSITQFPLPRLLQTKGDLIVTADGTVWFALVGGIGSLKADGTIATYPTTTVDPRYPTVEDIEDSPSHLAAGPDGRVWFFSGRGAIGRITPKGRLSEFALANENEPLSLAAGPEGTVWYSTAGQPPCEGGGGGCYIQPYFTGIVGRIDPGPQEVAVESVRSAERLHQLDIRLSCAGGRGDQRCRGKLRLTRHGVTVVRRTFAVVGDGEGTVTARLGRRARRLLNRPRRLDLTAIVTLAGAQGSTTTRDSVPLPPAGKR